MRPWCVYLIECQDGSVYTGITNDLARRYAQHVAGKGARYTRSHPPARLVGHLPHPDRASASRAEHAIKQLPAIRKRALFAAARESLAMLGPVADVGTAVATDSD